MTSIEEIKEAVAAAMMQRNGYGTKEDNEWPIEWDLSRNDSQYTMIREDVFYIIDSFLQELTKYSEEVLQEEEEEETEEEVKEESIFDEYGHIRRTQTNTTNAAFFLFMDAGTGKPRYVRDVREWLANVDRLHISDDTEIEGQLYLNVDVALQNAEIIECLECGQHGDILLTAHKCAHA